jgi:hypothetical protein
MQSAAAQSARLQLSILALGLAVLCVLAARLGFPADGPGSPNGWELRLTTSVMAADHSGSTANVCGRSVSGSITYAERDYSGLFPYSQPLYLVELAADHGTWGVSAPGPAPRLGERLPPQN